ncbi:hypothetical protein [Halorussus halobius]|uniref:hypothetical protein n=1 Tax=Halorussus halobius TaxID=1710537 RepID=UPI001091BFEC|nr:hypothetical protein [Halorussus halobius]
MTSRGETRAPEIDVLECLALLVVPAVLVGGAATLAGGDQSVPGLFVGGLFGAMLVGYRRLFYAVRTDEGIERRSRAARERASDHWTVRVARAEYDPRVEWAVVALAGAVGAVSLASLVLVEPGRRPPLRLVLFGALGLPAALFAAVVSAVQD